MSMNPDHAFLRVPYLLVSFMAKGDNTDDDIVWLVGRNSMLSIWVSPICQPEKLVTICKVDCDFIIYLSGLHFYFEKKIVPFTLILNSMSGLI